MRAGARAPITRATIGRGNIFTLRRRALPINDALGEREPTIVGGGRRAFITSPQAIGGDAAA